MTARRVLITGASRGIGYALAERLARLGHVPVGFARSSPAEFPGEFQEVDLASRRATDAALSKVLSDGPVDAVVNNVGLGRPGMLGEIDLDDLAELYDLNVRAAVQVTQAVLQSMKARGWGRIVNVTSLVTVGLIDRTAYGASKAALEFCSRAWASELGGSGITVNSVAPGPTETGLFRQHNPEGSPSAERFLASSRLGRFARPGEIAAAIAFLLSEEAGYITGQTLRVDGGGSIAGATGVAA
ncbi:MAG: SDR family oxidoreductase [Streptosporangiaceae bacterium]|jgi:3-oxoacyl-[acyl-carrier protein] reductase